MVSSYEFFQFIGSLNLIFANFKDKYKRLQEIDMERSVVRKIQKTQHIGSAIELVIPFLQELDKSKLELLQSLDLKITLNLLLKMSLKGKRIARFIFFLEGGQFVTKNALSKKNAMPLLTFVLENLSDSDLKTLIECQIGIRRV